MIKNSQNTIYVMSCYILIIVCIILTILTVSPKEGCAANIYKYNFSKYYKKYSSKSPEYVVINFIELADSSAKMQVEKIVNVYRYIGL